VSGGGVTVVAFGCGEEVDDGATGVPERAACPCGGPSEQGRTRVAAAGIHDHRVAGAKCRHAHLPGIGEKALTVDRAAVETGGFTPYPPKRQRDQSCALPDPGA